MATTITEKKQKRRPKKGQKNQRERASPSHGRKLYHPQPLYSSTLMLGGLKQASPANTIFPFMHHVLMPQSSKKTHVMIAY